MDVPRDPAILKRKRRRQIGGAIVAGLAVIGVSVAVSRLEPAAPSIAGSWRRPGDGPKRRGCSSRGMRS